MAPVRAPPRSGDQDELPTDVSALTDAVCVGGAVEGKGLT